MADIFLSYAEGDRAVASKLASLLESLGWSVWWDTKIPAGKTWRTIIEQTIEATPCVLVLWSKNSISSQWVHEEAEVARSQNKLFPVLIEPVKPPFGFRGIQALNLTDWEGSAQTPSFRQLICELETLLDRTRQVEREARPRSGQRTSRKQQVNPALSRQQAIRVQISKLRVLPRSWLVLAMSALATMRCSSI